MTWQKGESGNTAGVPKGSRQALTKIRLAINLGITNMKAKNGEFIGVAALGHKITKELEATDSPSKVLKDLAPLLPKDMLIESVQGLQRLTDNELQDIIADRARERRTLEGELANTLLNQDDTHDIPDTDTHDTLTIEHTDSK